MGYDTSFSLRLVKGDPAEYDKFIEKLRKKSGYDGLCDGDCYDGEGIHWYDHEKDLKSVTKKFPDLIIEVNGVGEDYDDIWTERWQNGRSEGYGCIKSSPFFLLATDEERRKRLDTIVSTAEKELRNAICILINESPETLVSIDSNGKRHFKVTVGAEDLDISIIQSAASDDEDVLICTPDGDVISSLGVDTLKLITDYLLAHAVRKD